MTNSEIFSPNETLISFLELTIQNNSLPCLLVNPNKDYLIVKANKFAEDLYGFSLNELIRMRFSDLCLDNQLSAESELTNAAILSSQPFRVKQVFANHSIHVVEILPIHYGEYLLFQIHTGNPDEISSVSAYTSDQFTNIFQNMLSGFALHEIIQDHDGTPIDYRYLEVNPAFERIIGVDAANIIGKTVLEVWPETEKYWIEQYGEVALGGKTIQFDNYSKSFDKYFNVHAYSPRLGQFVVLFLDITESKKHNLELSEQRDLFSNLAENINEVFWIRNPEGKIIYITPSFESVYQRRVDDLLRDENILTDQIHPDDRSFVIEHIKNLIEKKESYEIEYRIVHNNGSAHCLHSRAYPYFDKNEKLSRFVGVVRDISQQKQFEQRIKNASIEREHDLAVLFQTSHVANQKIGFDDAIQNLIQMISKITSAFSSILVITGLNHSDKGKIITYPLKMKQVVDFSTNTDNLLKALAKFDQQQLINGKKFQEIPLMLDDQILVTPVGKYGYLLLIFHPELEITTGNSTRILAISDQLSLVLENLDLQKQMKNSAIIEERQRISRELHDSVTQSLYSLNLVSRAGLDRLDEEAWDEVRECLEEIQVNALQALKEMRLLLYELHPPILEDAGLMQAIENRLNSVERKTRINVLFEYKVEHILPKIVQAELYRVIIEALNNSLKHAKAKTVSISVFSDAQKILIEIEDDGVGFDLEQGAQVGFGLSAMQERICKLNGQIRIRSEPMRGTLIQVSSPLLEVKQ